MTIKFYITSGCRASEIATRPRLDSPRSMPVWVAGLDRGIGVPAPRLSGGAEEVPDDGRHTARYTTPLE